MERTEDEYELVEPPTIEEFIQGVETGAIEEWPPYWREFSKHAVKEFKRLQAQVPKPGERVISRENLRAAFNAVVDIEDEEQDIRAWFSLVARELFGPESREGDAG